MTVTATSLGSRPGRKSSRVRFLRRRARATAVPVICPYLIAGDGAWRSARPSREHHCGAVTPAAPLAIDKQRRLCLAKAHASCATHLAALAEAAGARTIASEDRFDAAPAATPGGATRWSLVRTVPVVLDEPGGSVPGGPDRRRAGQIALGGLMALALGAVVLARIPEAEPTASGSPAVLAATGQPAAAAVSSATSRPRAVLNSSTPSASEIVAPTRSTRPSPTGSASAASSTPGAASPTRAAVHVVAPGDTLIALARAYETTVEAIQATNGLGDSTTLLIGQEIRLP